MNTTDGQPATERVTEIWIACGVRAISGTRYAQFLDPAGHPMVYGRKIGRRPWRIGAAYRVTVERDAEGKNAVIYGMPEPTGEMHEDTDAVQRWAVESMVAEQKLALAIVDRKARGAIDEALWPLLELAAATIRTGAERDALTALVVRRISDALINPGVFPRQHEVVEIRDGY